MVSTLVYAVVAAIVVGVIWWALARPRSLAGRWVRRGWWWLSERASQERDEAISRRVEEINTALNSKIEAVHDQLLRRVEKLELAVARIAEDLAGRQCAEEGNPDDEFRSDWQRWFAGDPTANVDYSRKQERDLAGLRDGLYQRHSG
jgi:hypothetical protein